MTEQTQNRYSPDVVSPPGETLEEVLEVRGMSQSDLAERTGRPKKTINEIIKGKAAITAETAIQLERVLGIEAAFWMAREQKYRESLARAKELQELETYADWLDTIPYRAIAKLGWATLHKERSLQAEEILRFFGVASQASWDGLWGRLAASFRQSSAFETQLGAVAAWLRQGEIEASRLECEDYSEQSFKTALAKVRSMTLESPRESLRAVQSVCGKSGVAVVFVPEIPGTNVWGATRWINPTRALLQLSLRYKTDDHLWFTFFHEAGHILLHGKRDVFVEDEVQGRSEMEEEADAFAREYLIPNQRYRIFLRKSSFSCAAVSRFAYEIGVAPGIVVGRLQHDGKMDPASCFELKKKVNWDSIPTAGGPHGRS